MNILKCIKKTQNISHTMVPRNASRIIKVGAVQVDVWPILMPETTSNTINTINNKKYAMNTDST